MHDRNDSWYMLHHEAPEPKMALTSKILLIAATSSMEYPTCEDSEWFKTSLPPDLQLHARPDLSNDASSSIECSSSETSWCD